MPFYAMLKGCTQPPLQRRGVLKRSPWQPHYLLAVRRARLAPLARSPLPHPTHTFPLQEKQSENRRHFSAKYRPMSRSFTTHGSAVTFVLHSKTFPFLRNADGKIKIDDLLLSFTISFDAYLYVETCVASVITNRVIIKQCVNLNGKIYSVTNLSSHISNYVFKHGYSNKTVAIVGFCHRLGKNY